MAIIMTNQISQTIENWQTMSIAECLSFVDDLVYHASDSDEEDTLSILHELFSGKSMGVVMRR